MSAPYQEFSRENALRVLYDWLTAGGTTDPGATPPGMASGTYVPRSALTYLPLPTGVAATDTANLNAVLARGGRIRPNPLAVTASYSLTAPLVLAPGGNTDVDFGGCTFVLTGTFNMLQSAACTPVATATDAATTSGSSVVVSPTLAAVAVVGQQLGVVGAGPVGGEGGANRLWLYGTVLSIAGNNITLTGNANGVAASVTLAGATAYLFNRDKQVTVRGGTWDAGTIWNTTATRWNAAYNSNLLRFRRVDRLTVRDVVVKQTSFPYAGGWCFAVNPGDCTDVLIENITGVGTSTCVQGQGPLSRVIVRNIYGQTQDDQVAFGTVGAGFDDTEGDIKALEIDGVQANGSLRCLDLFAGQGANGAVRPLTGVSARGLKGTTNEDVCRFVGYAYSGTTNVVITASVEDVTATPGGGYKQVSSDPAQTGIAITGPDTGSEIAYAQITANVSGLGPAQADVTGLSITLVAPPSGRVIIEAFAYSVGGATGASSVVVHITDSSNVVKTQMFAGALAAAAFSPAISGRVRITGLTPGTSYTYKARISGTTAQGALTVAAGATYPAFIRALSD